MNGNKNLSIIFIGNFGSFVKFNKNIGFSGVNNLYTFQVGFNILS